ncbi:MULTISPECIES: nuclear transport factor 2 family protein [unclassified Spirosoma]|uniref:nuclear transport factor 2 family protein n=1 Tax=unclassified Spirosoma TaxID=2621999 RepID=UPI000959A6E2|nr:MULTISPECIES: nuclear transport factor 2 family protein [unclassified Spirosoma]MBN8823942.1 nuclear transport factor 2 family protein [Spirosoma sp.]OJW79419.1 MAG: hypothetical protein BGO59_04300 [Spirosoma sp. 48-14]
MSFRFLIPFLLALWLIACGELAPPDLRQAQALNLQLTRSVHACINRQDWTGLHKLFAPRVRYRGRALGAAEQELPRSNFLANYRQLLQIYHPGQFTLRQLYSAGAYHVVVEGLTTNPDTVYPICLIYTIEHHQISRVCAY